MSATFHVGPSPRGRRYGGRQNGCALLLAATLLSACTPAAPPVTGDACEAACRRRAELGCLEAAIAAQCVPVCKKSAARGLFDPVCAARAEDVDAMAECNVRCGR